ncbi:MAG: tail protein X, partial [Robiginitomaculum sp.]|nr:tail protein X [Robiginitomaculum sp.]
IEALPAVLAANPHIRKHPPHLPVGTLITLPELPAPPAKQTTRLWD